MSAPSEEIDIECFRIDESRYTGFDLLNTDQRFQGASAIAISDEDGRRLIREHFPRLQAAELKYRTLSRRPANYSHLIHQNPVVTDSKLIPLRASWRQMLERLQLAGCHQLFESHRGWKQRSFSCIGKRSQALL